MILLDTNAIIWVEAGHRRARGLLESGKRIYISPASILELQILLELGRIRLRAKSFVRDITDDDRWALDEPPSIAWFEEARSLSWTRDPHDRLIVAHARLRGWRLATADQEILEALDPDEVVEL